MTTRPRSPSTETAGPSKKTKTTASSHSFPDPTPLASAYQSSQPYKHASVPGLFEDELLEGVVLESQTYGVRGEEGSLAGWGWEQKETDIYKIQQTPDLTSLSPEHLPSETLSALPYLTRLKSTIYSPEFRSFIQSVTNCGPLSGTKVDGSVGLYSEGSHLLLHDDSISTRVVSYILYLPNSPNVEGETVEGQVLSKDGSFLKGWREEWGGALELYPISTNESNGTSSLSKEIAIVGPPSNTYSKSLPVKWGNLIFFQVQPGCSYHAVQEVIVGNGKKRLGVSGWFHRPVEGEEGYKKEGYGDFKGLSSLEQITSAPSIPFSPYPSPDPPSGLTSSQLKHLSKFLSPSYLSATTLEKLAGQFAESSEVVMHNFLLPELVEKIKQETIKADSAYGSGLTDQNLGVGEGWELKGPPSKYRYLGLGDGETGTPAIQSVAKELYPSEAFRAWTQVVSSLVVMGYKSEARRFRKGLDYTLANGEPRDGEPRLDVILGLSSWNDGKEDDDVVKYGGWECYLAAPEEDEDPAVFQSAQAKGKAVESNETNGAPVKATNGEESAPVEANGPSISINGVELEFDESQLSDGDFDTDSEAEGDDGPLLTLPMGFNQMLLVLRDPGVMRFVKYLSGGAEGSRWDVAGEFEVGQLEEEDEEEE